ncbi:MAG: hypothetical protein A2044_00860 [Candidatus Firestonebacteria bacterium GWA2_43_8]|nr:MAG: hypothetical protein A2044_00860 [Candidatus Firestonebacteria bacterium GWA2_43_8]
MKILKVILAVFMFTGLCLAQQKFTFAVADIIINESAVSNQIKLVTTKDEGMENMLAFLEKNTTIKVDKEIPIVTFKKVSDIEKYPFIFISANGPIKFSDAECKNMAEYCKRGGFIFVDDCVYENKQSLFFHSFKDLVEKKIFPGKKAEMLSFDHEIYHCHFDLPAGLPYVQGEPSGGWAITDDKGRVMMFLAPTDIHCGWFTTFGFSDLQTKQSFQFMANLVIYTMTH